MEQSLKIILDSSLQSKFDKSKYVLESNININPEYVSIHKVEEYIENTYQEQTNNGLINAFLLAYNNHLPLKIKPDDIHITLQFVLSTFINNNTNELRDLFVESKDKKELFVEHDKLDFNVFGQLMVNEVKQNVKDSKLIDILETNYSTTNDIIKTVSNLLILNTLKEYFSYGFILGCGIPFIILDGTQDDWLLLKSKYDNIKGICNLVQKNELIDWFPCMDKIMTMFVDLRMLSKCGVVNAPTHYKLLFERVISFVPQGSGGDTILGGWISVLSPYTSENKIKKIFIGLPCLDITIDIPQQNNKNIYQYQDILKKFYGGCDWNSFQTTQFITPATLTDYDGTKYKIQIEAGLSPKSYINQNNEVEVNYLYDIKKESDKYKKQFEYYKEKGYYVDNRKCLKYPKKYYNNHDIDLFDIMKLFGVYCASYDNANLS
jgi:hypothetical protein